MSREERAKDAPSNLKPQASNLKKWKEKTGLYGRYLLEAKQD